MLDAINSQFLSFLSSFSLIAVAELGDKSQLVCMALAVRYRAWPVFFGVVMAFSVLNLLAVLFGASVAYWLPEQVLSVIVGVLFLLFGLHALRNVPEVSSEEVVEKSNHSILISAFLLIFVAELGDKTQIAVAGLSSVADPVAVWTGATLALGLSSCLAIWAGRALMQHISMAVIHKLSGGLFIVFGVAALITGLLK